MDLATLGITKDDIIDRAVEKLLEEAESIEHWNLAEKVRHRAVEEIIKAAEPKIDAILSEALSGLVDSPFTPVDEWGEKKSAKPTSLRQMVKDKALSYLSEKVDENGKPGWNANVTRGEWMARKAAEDSLDSATKRELMTAVASAKADVQQRVAEFVAKTILQK